MEYRFCTLSFKNEYNQTIRLKINESKLIVPFITNDFFEIWKLFIDDLIFKIEF